MGILADSGSRFHPAGTSCKRGLECVSCDKLVCDIHTLHSSLGFSTDEIYTWQTLEKNVGGDAYVACPRCNWCGGTINSSIRYPYLDNSTHPKTHTESISTAVVPVEPNQDLETGGETSWESLPDEIREHVFRKLEVEEIFRQKSVSKGFKELAERPTFQGSLTSLFMYREGGGLQWLGYDTTVKKWRPLPTLVQFLPHPDPTLFVSAGDGLLCVCNVSESLQNQELIVCNPLTQQTRILPPLNFPRSPVLMHVVANPRGLSYRVIVAGSAGLRNEGCQVDLSRKTEVFDSVTSQWEVTGDVPGVEFCLNEYQTGVRINNTLYCIVTLEDGSGRCVLAYDVEERNWLLHWKCPLPILPGDADAFCNTQLVECNGGVHLFLELQIGEETVEHRIYKLEGNTNGAAVGSGRWKNVVREQKSGGRGLLVYPEYTCASFGAGRVCIFNTLDLTGKVYDIHDGGHSESIIPSPQGIRGGELFHTLNPLSFEFIPNFTFTISGRMRWPISLPATENVYHDAEVFELFPPLL